MPNQLGGVNIAPMLCFVAHVAHTFGARYFLSLDNMQLFQSLHADCFSLEKIHCKNSWKTDFYTSPKINCERHPGGYFTKRSSYKVQCKQDSSAKVVRKISRERFNCEQSRKRKKSDDHVRMTFVLYANFKKIHMSYSRKLSSGHKTIQKRRADLHSQFARKRPFINKRNKIKCLELKICRNANRLLEENSVIR